VQAVGRDAAGRWQYVYHDDHVRQRERKKFQRLIRFGAALPRLRRAVARDLRIRELTRDRVLATVVRILACAFIRPGSEAYAAENGTYGLATLRRKHVTVSADTVHFDFVAKSGKRQQRALRDRGVARVVRRLLALPGYEVFKYVDAGGAVVDIKRADINEYIKRHMGDSFSAKVFRTWTATLLCACALARRRDALESPRTRSAVKKAMAAAVKETAQHLGNTPAICRASYVSPGVLGAYERGRVVDGSLAAVEELIARRLHSWHDAERALLALLEQDDARQATRKSHDLRDVSFRSRSTAPTERPPSREGWRVEARSPIGAIRVGARKSRILLGSPSKSGVAG
jgi:DNA topoisomerase-1